MCVDPITMASMAMTIGSGVAQVASQAKAAKEQAKAQLLASVAETKRHEHRMSSERLAQSQRETSTALEALKANREAEEGMGTTRTAATEGGVEGNAVGLAVADFAQKNAAYQTQLMLQERMNNASMIMDFRGGGLQYQQNLTKINKPIQGPDYLGTFLNVGGQALGQFQTGQLRELQMDNLGLENQLFGQRLQQARLATQQAGMTLNFVGEQRRTQSAGAGLYGASRRAIPTR